MRRWTWSLLLLVVMPTASFLLVWAWPQVASTPGAVARPAGRPAATSSADSPAAPSTAASQAPARREEGAATPAQALPRPAQPSPTPDGASPAAGPPVQPEAERLAAALRDSVRELHAGQQEAFDEALADWQAGRRPQAGPLPAMEAPALPTPTASAEPGSLAVSWDEYDSVIEVSDAPADAEGRRPAKVTTFDRQGKELVNYQAQAYRSADGKLVIDARGAEIAGPWARFWSPDSFTVDDDLQVTTIDDLHRSSDGSGAPADGG